MSRTQMSGTQMSACHERGIQLETPRTTREPHGDPVLTLHGVSIAYEDREEPAVKGVDLTVYEGESVLLLGPSGCGKSTLAMLCAGLIPHSVEAVVTGHVERHPELSQPGSVGYVFQDPEAQFCMLQIDDEVAFGLENQKMPREMMLPRIQHALEKSGLHQPLHHPHNKLSGGQKQRLAIAAALAMNPRLLILDEPTANLDPFATREVFLRIRELSQKRQTMIVIEHKFHALLPFMDRVVLFDREGRIHCEGPTGEVVESEWAWMVEHGVVAPWQSLPGLLDPRTRTMSGGAVRDPHVSRDVQEPKTQRRADTNHETKRAAYKVSDLGFSYGDHPVLENVHLTIPAGAMTAIVGPNGAGKSSLLKVLAALERPTRGRVELLGHDMRSRRGLRNLYEDISYCFQNPEHQFIYQRVGDELANQVVGEDVPDDVRALLQEFGLQGTEQQSPFGLSQGQKRRLSVACMVRQEHAVYLLDEPTFGQDAATQSAIMTRLRRLCDAGKTVILTTHDMDLVRRFADHVIVLAEGEVLFHGAPDELFRNEHVLKTAHLLDDIQLDEPDVDENPSDANVGAQTSGLRRPVPERKARWTDGLHHGWLFVTVLAAGLLSMLAHTLPQAIAVFTWPVLLMMVTARMSPWKIFKRLSVFFGFYVLYIFSFAAFAATPPGTKTIDVLWAHFSVYGLNQGIVLAFRMISSVAFAVYFVSVVDYTDFLVSLSQTFRIPPKFAYGTLAGLRVVPLFQSEWEKLHQARQLRGKEGRFPWLRPVTYALPILAQGIRMSERVAIAMEARGFIGPAADSAQGRTYYRVVNTRARDFVFMFVVLAVEASLLVFFK
jgi:energy-coupling factor transport system permease/ATP-binding protein